MKIGGNGAASDFFAAHGASALLAPSTEGKAKYTSQAAQLYREELKRRSLQDAAGLPLTAAFVLPRVGTAAGARNAQPNGDMDFFDEWDKPAAHIQSVELPVEASVPPMEAVLTPGAPEPAPAPAARPITSAALRAQGAGASARRSVALGAVRQGNSLLGAKPGKLGLGVRKTNAAINFDEAERRIKEEQSRAAIAAREAQVAAEATAAPTETQQELTTAAASAPAPAPAPVSPMSANKATPNKESGDDRLGMGFMRLGLAQARSKAQLQKNAPKESIVDAAETDYARSKFAAQKCTLKKKLIAAISSDQYFERGGYDSNASAEAQSRLSNFQGQASISSSQYLYVLMPTHHSGREEEEHDEYEPEERDDFAELEASAKAYYRNFMANPDVQQGIESFRTGALKLSRYLEDLSRNGA
ncbi:ADP-ribosylation factor GTPase activating protein, ER-Golgi transport [Malassezia vespertilionis]|uniref:ADP-ribosylation factor GTPase activating protein, ER-Golgi transport n=1 Tax=Malassezia vespertilionis TaxID=2020962 RepID=UPI0024B0A753|nr:ADP-ribosylation factor GTPase activating protein, ER-Golgi transport [Malassezia vespertilionis]WFD07645.1 ADP-ribosylation factor GTPase activating protein, ER-Golgi transport [Malassezia vespertilionis]